MAEDTIQDQTTTDEQEEVVIVAEKADIDKGFKVGDKITVNYKILEGEKARIQPFEGIVISKRGMGVSKSFTVRRISTGNVGVERIFPSYSPNIESIKVKSSSKVRRAKLYYMRERVGKAASKVN